MPYASRPPKELARPRKVDQYPIRIGCSSTLYHICVMRRYAGFEQDSSMPSMNRSAAREEKFLHPPSAIQIPPQRKMFAPSHFATENFCIAKLVGYSNYFMVSTTNSYEGLENLRTSIQSKIPIRASCTASQPSGHPS
jgi:hypothetical protein